MHVRIKHEGQGLTSKHVALVRIDKKFRTILESLPHAIVVLTIHTETLKFLTTGDKDLVRKLLIRATNETRVIH